MTQQPKFPDWLQRQNQKQDMQRQPAQVGQPQQAPDWVRQQGAIRAQVQKAANPEPAPLNDLTRMNAAQYKVWLSEQNMMSDPFPNSDGAENPYCEQGQMSEDARREANKAYEAVLKDYMYHKSQPDMHDFEDPNIGYKLHLNVVPEHVSAVSQYLIGKGYRHKYLHGGDVEDGKIFTVYIGSRKLAARLAQVIAKDLAGKLCKPRVTSSVEFAPNVIARFNTSNTSGEFTRYPSAGVRGMPVLSIFGRIPALGEPNTKTKNLAFDSSYQELQKQFGEYFTG